MTTRPDLDALVAELTPIRPVQPWSVALLGVLTVAIGVAVIWAFIGPRTQYGPSFADPIFVVRAGLLALLATASLATIARMARPSVGTAQHGWRWALAAAAVIPAAALVVAMADGVPMADRLNMVDGMECLRWSLGIGLFAGAGLTVWLRRGAPVSPERIGWLVGIASGSLGALAFTVHCPYSDIVYIAFWNAAGIVLAALIARLIVPPLVRW